jgi:aspartate aminotransferase-like enzyme
MRERRLSFKADYKDFQPVVAQFPKIVTPTAVVRLALRVLAQRIEAEGVEKVMMETR